MGDTYGGFGGGSSDGSSYGYGGAYGSSDGIGYGGAYGGGPPPSVLDGSAFLPAWTETDRGAYKRTTGWKKERAGWGFVSV